MATLQLEGISKCYGKHWAIQDINLEARSGMIGLVGPNGAGKTTLLRIIATLLKPTRGRILWDGIDTHRESLNLRAVLGYLPQQFGVYPELTARQFLGYIAAMKGIPERMISDRVADVLAQVNLTSAADETLVKFSGGMKQRVGIAQALLNDPLVLVVDEPTAGLDPEERVRLRMLLAGLTGQRLIMLSTHIIADVEAVASRILILNHGRIHADTTAEQLIAAARGNVWSLETTPETAHSIQTHYLITSRRPSTTGVTFQIVHATQPHRQAIPSEPSLEDAYLYTMHRAFGAGTHSLD